MAILKEKIQYLTTTLFLLLSILLRPSLVSSDQAFITQTCGRVQHTDLCLKVLLADDRYNSCGALTCAALMALEATASITTTNAETIANRSSEVTKVLKPAYDMCVNTYHDVKSILDGAVNDFAGTKFKVVMNEVHDAENKAEECESRFYTYPTPLTDINLVFKNMTEFTSDLIQLTING